MNRFRKKSETRRTQALDDPRLVDLNRSTSSSSSNQPAYLQNKSNVFGHLSNPTATVFVAATPPALPALSTGSEFRTSLIFPDLTRSFQQSGRPAHLAESKIRSKLAEQRLHGINEERITEEEEEVMFAALSSIQGIRRARGNSTASVNNSSTSSGPVAGSGDASGDLLYPESVGSGRSPGLASNFSDNSNASAAETPSIYPFASLSSHSSQSSSTSASSSRRLSNNLFGSSRFRDASYMKGSQRNRSISATNSTASGNTNNSSAAIALTTSNGVFEELSSTSTSPSPSPIEPHSSSSASSVSFAIQPHPAHQHHQHLQGQGQPNDKERTPVARSTNLPLPQTPSTAGLTLPAVTLPNGNPLTAAQIRRISVALERAISSIVENEHEADDEEEHILAPHSVPLGGAYPARARPPTAFNDPSNPIEVSDLNAVLMYLETSRQSHAHSISHSRESSTSSPVPVSSTPTPGYVPGMNRPISPRDFANAAHANATSSSGHDSEDYSTTPRATSPVPSYSRSGGGGGGGVLVPKRHHHAQHQGGGGGSGSGSGTGNGRPSTAPTRVGMSMASSTTPGDWRGQYLQQQQQQQQQQRQEGAEPSASGATGLERSYSSGQAYERRFQSPGGDINAHHQPVISGYAHRRRPSSPLAHEHFTAASISTNVNGGSASLAVAAAALQRSMNSPITPSSSNDSGSDTQVQAPRGAMAMAQAQAQANGRAVHAPASSTSASDADHSADIANGQGLSREKSLTRSMTGPSLPDSPLVDEEAFNYFPIPATQNWALNLERQAAGDTSATGTNGGASVGGIIMPQPTARMAVQPASVPHIPRSQTPNNIARSSTPVAPAVSIPAVVPGGQISPIARVGTPNYLVQRSPSANGFHTDNSQDLSDSIVRRAASPRPIVARAGTLSHTPSTSSTSAYNPMLHSSLGSSSRASTGSVGSSYHSSDEGEANARFREAANWLFDPESKGSNFVSTRAKARKGQPTGDSEDSSNERESKDDASDSIGDQEDVLQLLTGLTKRDLSNIQQKLVSASVAREAEDAIRLSQRRRRPSVQSREFVNSTPKPQVTTQTEPVAQQSIPVVINRVQSPAPEVRAEPEPVAPQEPVQDVPLIVTRPLSPVGEPPTVYTITEEFEVPSAATTPPRGELEVPATPPVEQSPRAKALAEALFGDKPEPTVASPEMNRSAEELHDEVERKVIAATVALKNPTLTVEGGSPLKRKGTKKIDLQKISGPQLVSASMSVDAIPLASPSVTSLGPVNSPLETVKSSSGLGSKLRRLHNSLRTKNSNSVHEREHSSGSGHVVQESTSAGLTQVVNYYPQGLQAPQVRSVPPHGGDALNTGKSSTTSAAPTTPPATAGPAGLKGFITRLRQPKGGSIRRAEGSPRPAVSMQPSAFMSSPHLSENEPTAPQSIPVLNRAPPSDSLSIPSVNTQTPDEALRQLFNAANNLGLDPAALNELLANRAASQASQASKAPVWTPSTDSRPGTSSQRYDDSSSSSWTTAQNSAAPSRQQSTRVKVEPTVRLRPAREGGNPQSAVVRRTIIYPSSAPNSTGSPLPGQGRNAGPQRKMSTASNGKRRPMSFQSGLSTKSVHERTPTPPPPRGAAAKRMSHDGHPPMPGSLLSSGRPGTSAGIINDGNGSIDLQEGSPDGPILEDGRALQVIELENGEVIWSVLDSLRSPGDDMDDDSTYFSNRGSFASHYSGANDSVQISIKGLGRSASRAGANNGAPRGSSDVNRPETKVFYSDAKEIAHIIGQITNATDYGQFNMNPSTPSTRSSNDLPVEEQLERLMSRLTETR